MEKSKDTLINVELTRGEIGTIIMALSSQAGFYTMLASTFGGSMLENQEAFANTVKDIQVKLIGIVGEQANANVH